MVNEEGGNMAAFALSLAGGILVLMGVLGIAAKKE